jgi:hypothetical protein
VNSEREQLGKPVGQRMIPNDNALRPEGAPYRGLAQTGALSRGQAQTGALSRELAQTGALSRGLAQTGALSRGLAQTGALSRGLAQTGALSRGLAQTGALSSLAEGERPAGSRDFYSDGQYLLPALTDRTDCSGRDCSAVRFW